MQSLAFKLCPTCGARAVGSPRYCPACGNDLLGVTELDGDPYVEMIVADRYQLTELLGTGAMGRVYRARQTTLGKLFAVKLLHPHLTGDSDTQARFANEAHNSAALNHPNIVSVVDYGRTAEGISYLVMEYVEGRSLEDVIVEDFPLARDRIIDLTLQILAALTEAHGHGVLHRDLKPENIFVQTLRTRGELVKILDFGIATLMDDSARAARPKLTGHGMVCGTPEYMSPEQARGHALDARSDLYAVGVILYQLLTGVVPFASESALEILHKHLRELPVPPAVALGRPVDPLDEICLRALAKDRADRFADATAFRDALLAISRAPAAAAAPQVLRCSECAAVMRSEDRFCPACGAASPQRTESAPQRANPALARHRTRLSGAVSAATDQSDTAELLARNFPLPLIERDEVLSSTLARLEAPVAGTLVRAVSGAYGIGKTRLLDEVAAVAERYGWQVLAVGCDPSGASSPLWPIRQICAALLQAPADQITPSQLGRAVNLLGLSYDSLPGLAELFGMQGPASELELAVRRRECLASAVEVVMQGAGSRPLLLLLDDLEQWDVTSRLVLRRIARASVAGSVMCLVATTEEDVEWLTSDVHRLGALSQQGVQSALAELARERQYHGELLRQVGAWGDVNPLALEQALRLAASGKAPSSLANLAELIGQRVSALDPVALGLLRAASVLGDRILDSELQKVISEVNGKAPDWETDDALARLHVEGLLIISGPGERMFPHRKLRELVYGEILGPARANLHAAAAKLPSVLADPVVLAMHLLRAGAAGAREALDAAAFFAARRFDDRKSVVLLRAALKLAESSDAGPGPSKAKIAAALSSAHRFVGELAPAESIARGALEHSTDPEETAALERALGLVLLAQKREREGAVCFERTIGLAISRGDITLALGVYCDLAKALMACGETARARKELLEGLDLATFGEGARAEVDFDIWRYLLAVSSAAYATGDKAEARTWAEHAAWQANRRDSALGGLRCHAELARLLVELDQQVLAEQHLVQALEYARLCGDRLSTAEILGERGRIRAKKGLTADALRYYDEALRVAKLIDWREGVAHLVKTLDLLRRLTQN